MAGGNVGMTANKIKGGRWTVFRFFFVSLAFTIGWMTVASLLGHYKLKYGPAILLQMNIAYFLPSIPLLVGSSFLDEWLDRKFGVAKTILFRLTFGLGGCAAVTAVWPFAHSSRRMLLLLVVILGLVAGVAFSASYQLVARFANKNTISLGLGCVGSGIITLLLEVAIQMGPSPTRKQELVLFELTAGVIILGTLAAFSLLIRHWKAIEASTPQQHHDDLNEPLLSEELGASAGRQIDIARSRSMRKSLSLMLRYTPLDLFDTMSEAERMEDEDQTLLAVRDLFSRQTSTPKRKELHWEEPPPYNSTPFTQPQSSFAEAQEDQGLGQAGVDEQAGHLHNQQEAQDQVRALDLVKIVWPIMAALFLAGVILCMVFPFFTYVPSSGVLRDSLPKVLFFIRLFADLLGRTLPRKKSLAITSQRLLFSLSCILTATVPLFFAYLKSAARFHSDYLVMAYVVCVWASLGYINTCAYMLAPQRVPASAKGAVNGALAIVYQVSHCVGLLIAVLLAVVLYGHL